MKIQKFLEDLTTALMKKEIQLNSVKAILKIFEKSLSEKEKKRWKNEIVKFYYLDYTSIT